MTSLPPARGGARRRGLGRGLDALLGPIGDAPPAPREAGDASSGSPSTASLVEVDPALVDADPEQPRRDFEQEALVALGESIRTHGLLHPIVGRAERHRYQLVAGERRLRGVAAGRPGWCRPSSDPLRTRPVNRSRRR